jgi:protein required for attachment to host cells
MTDCCVIVVNGARARFFTLEPAEDSPLAGGPNLIERSDLVNPEQDQHDGSLWSDTKTGRNRAGGGGQAHGYDDHREGHLDEFRKRFARMVASEAAGLVRGNGSRRVIVAAQKRMLGFLRSELDPLLRTGVEVLDIAKDLSNMAPQALQQYLARERLVPVRRVPAA